MHVKKIRLSKLRKVQPQGFALIATITLMMLLALLSVGLLTIASQQIRISEKQIFASEAKSLARFSLETAIGQLQCELGPDQRISANSSILSSSSDGGATPYILGVWNSWDSWLNRNNSKGMSISSTYDKGRSSMFRRWLISDPNFAGLSQLSSGNSGLGKKSRANDPVRSVPMVSAGTLGIPVGGVEQDKKEVYARLVRVDDTSKTTGIKKNADIRKSIAWWITGENQKARITLSPHASEDSNDPITILRSTWDTPGPDLEKLGVSNLMPKASADNMAEVKKMITLDTMLVNSKTGRLRDVGDVYHDISLSSSGLLTDVKFGGLKKDLNLMFSQEQLPEDYRSDGESDVGLRPYAHKDGNATNRKRPIGSWNQLYLWANVWDSATTKSGQDKTATLQWDGQQATTLVASDATGNKEMMDNRYTYMRHPILLRFYSFVGVQYARFGGLSGTTPSINRGYVNLAFSVIPVYVWWNPYNVALKMAGADESPWGAYFGEHRFMPMMFSHNIQYGGAAGAFGDYKEHPLTPYTMNQVDPNDRQIADFGASFRDKVTLNENGSTEKGSPSVLKPGEIVIFAQPIPWIKDINNPFKENSIYNAKQNGYDIKVDNFAMKEGWAQDGAQTTGYSVNMYSGLRYEYFDGSPFAPATPFGATAIFARNYDDLKGWSGTASDRTPQDHILALKYRDQSASKSLGTFVMGAGVMDKKKIGTATALAGANTKDPVVFAKMMPSVLNMNWGAWEEPLLDRIKFPADGWLNNPPADANEEYNRQGRYGRADEDPTFVAYYGVSVKWGKPPVVGVYPKGRDYRTKIWQHSSPLLGGGQMPVASELARHYSPYQFEVKNATDHFFPITIGNVLSNDGTRLSPFGGPGAEQVNKIVAAELPFMQPGSLAGFAGCRLSPGWYQVSTREEMTKRFGYQSGVPGVGIGNSFADPMIPADRVFSSHNISGDAELGDFWDHGLMINDALWDTWFASSLAARPRNFGGSGKEDLQSVLKEAFSTDSKASNKMTQLANRRYMPNLQGLPADKVIAELAKEDDGYKMASKYLTVEGAFNVNSTSVRAWEATLLGLKKRKMLYTTANGRPAVLDDSGQVHFARFGVAGNDKSHVDSLGSIGVTHGITDGDAQAWSDLRTISDAQITSLAESIVKEVKKRGPFLNMSDFVNRRLQSGEMGVKGALQAAIDDSGINSTFDELAEMNITPGAGYPHRAAAQGSVYTAAPGYLIQSDVLAVLGNILTTRDDTFTVRAYGEVANRAGIVLSRAWCEAVVQRSINYVDPVNSPETAAKKINKKDGSEENTELSPVNKAFGRRFNIVSFRWLSPEEV